MFHAGRPLVKAQLPHALRLEIHNLNVLRSHFQIFIEFAFPKKTETIFDFIVNLKKKIICS
jgi:hypothetical protein